MKVLVLGSAGLQGKAVVYDLCRSPAVKEIVCLDSNLAALRKFERHLDKAKLRQHELDVRDKKALVELMRGVDVVIDVLPVAFMGPVVEAALEAGVDAVNTMYGHQLPEGIHERAMAENIIIMPECGCDPGIDLILCGYGASQLDNVSELHSYCGGFPEPQAIDNPLKYKITWSWHGVLLSYKRPARIMRDGEVILIPAKDQFAEKWIDVIDFPKLGKLELIPNGDAVIFAEYLGISENMKSTTRCTMRWPGHSEFWRKLVDLDFLSDGPVKGLPTELTPHQFMVKHLEPKLQYKDHEKDIVAMRNIIIGNRASDGAKIKLTFDICDYRDVETGLFAMNRTVGYTASIVAQMIVNGEIKGSGVLTPVRDVPYERAIEELRKRGIVINQSTEKL
jgi:lysine 6-dehydrogenase